jgi:dTDP-L-rhamnose 4-epimerase
MRFSSFFMMGKSGKFDMARTLVTGGGGFIGRHVVAELLAHGHTVRVYDAMIAQVHGDASADIPTDAEVMRGDMRDTDALRPALRGMDAVIHLAAEVGVGQSMYEIARYVGANDLGTAVLLDQMIEHPVEKIVVASSMSIYGEGTYAQPDGRLVQDARRDRADLRAGRWDPTGPDGAPLTPMPTTEDKVVDLASIYALTKYVQERAVLIHGAAYGVNAVALRLFNVFGAGQALSNPYTGVLANFASRLAKGERPMIFEDGAQMRDFVHVTDVARAFRLALDSPAAAGQVINIGSGQAYSISGVAELLARSMNLPELQPEILNKVRAGDIRNCFADISRARSLLGFTPERLLESGLDDFVEWVTQSTFTDRADDMRRHLEQRGLVA